MKKTIKKAIYFVGVLVLLFSLLPASYAVVTYAAAPTPAKVTLVSATVTKDNKVTVKWKKANNATSYRVYYKEKGASKWKKIMNVGADVLSYTHFNSNARPLKPGKTYVYTVKGYNMYSKKWGGYNKTGKSAKIPTTATTAATKIRSNR